jgi:hypothetical protein
MRVVERLKNDSSDWAVDHNFAEVETRRRLSSLARKPPFMVAQVEGTR